MGDRLMAEYDHVGYKEHHSMGSTKFTLLRRFVLIIAYWAICILALRFFYSGEGAFPVFNILASWGAVLAYRIETGGIVLTILLFFLYLVGLFALNTVLAHYAGRVGGLKLAGTIWHLPVIQIIIHWAGVIRAFHLYGEFRLPPVREFISVLGLLFMLRVICLPAIMSTLYIALDWRIAIKQKS